MHVLTFSSVIAMAIGLWFIADPRAREKRAGWVLLVVGTAGLSVMALRDFGALGGVGVLTVSTALAIFRIRS